MTIATCLFASFFAFNSAQAEEKKIRNPWKQCGIGAMIFTDEEDGTLAAVSNIIWDLGTTAMSSKVSSPDTCDRRQYSAAQFISVNHASLEVESARGETQKVAAISNLMGCSSAVTNDFAQELRVRSEKDMSDDAYASLSKEQKMEKYFNHVNDLAYGKFASQCRA